MKRLVKEWQGQRVPKSCQKENRCFGVWAHGAKAQRRDIQHIYGSGLTLAEGEREKDAKIERSMLRGAVGYPRGAEFELPRTGPPGVGGGVD